MYAVILALVFVNILILKFWYHNVSCRVKIVKDIMQGGK